MNKRMQSGATAFPSQPAALPGCRRERRGRRPVRLAARSAEAVLRLDVTQGNVQPLPIAMPDFLGGGLADADDRARRDADHRVQPAALRAVRADRSRRLSSRRSPNIDAVPRFADWRAINAQALVIGRISRQPDGRLERRLPAVGRVRAARRSTASNISTTPDNWRRIAHIISDAIYERLTGEKGYFDSRIVFIDETGPKERRVKRLAMMDQDGANVRYLTRGDDLVLTPRFSPIRRRRSPTCRTGRAIPGSICSTSRPAQREIVGNFPGMTLLAALLARRPARDHEPAAGRQFQHLRDGPALEGDDAAHRHAGDRHRAVLFAGRHAHLLRVRPRRQAADLRHGRERRPGAAHQLRRRHLFDAGVVAARRLHRLHQAGPGQVRHRRHAARRQRRAHPHRRLSTTKARPGRRTAA